MQYKSKHALHTIVAAMFVALLLQGCNGCNSNKKNPQLPEDSLRGDVHTLTAKDSLRTWTDRQLIQWKSWIDSSTASDFPTDSLQRMNVDTIALVDSTMMEDDRFEQFKPYFVYSPDSSQVVDLVSYGNFLHKGKNGKVALEAGEPDTEVAIVNVQTKKRERILFAGPSTVVKQAVWINDHTVLIAGGMYDEHNRLQPVIWKYDTESKLLENWETE